MENTIHHLDPQRVWHYFAEICRIPRPSKKEEKIVQYLVEFGQQLGLETFKDRVGNVVIRKPASAGCENWPSVALQSHVDMVCEKDPGIKHNFSSDPIIPRIEGEWVYATGTTLGADDGIGIAAQLAILEDENMVHGPIECLFTIDEETGLTGAFALSEDMLKSRMLINLDSEDEGELFIGCAGGRDTVGSFAYQSEEVNADFLPLKLSVSGLMGGHSGDDIQKGLGNANKILNRILWVLDKENGIRIQSFDGGNLRNAIARDANAIIFVPSNQLAKVKIAVEDFQNQIVEEYKITDKGVKVLSSAADIKDRFVMDINSQQTLLNIIYAMPHGVVAWSQEIPDFVETSTNLASVKMTNGKVHITTSQRSSIESAKDNICQMVASVFRLAGADYEHSDGYPGWKPNPNSRILDVTRSEFVKIFDSEPIVRAIHAGLECGLFSEKFPGLEMVSFGPTIKGAHSPAERIQIDTVGRFYQLVINVLGKLN